MALLDAGLPSTQFQVEGIDLGRENIKRARAGEYGNSSFRGRHLGFRERHLIMVNEEVWQVPESLRGLVKFEQASPLAPGFAPMRAPYDIIFCRNLFLYFDRETQIRTLEVLVKLLKPEGIVSAGAAEHELLEGLSFRPVSLELPFVLRRELKKSK
jgi:chemotaxis protein methyltransferase WspC